MPFCPNCGPILSDLGFIPICTSCGIYQGMDEEEINFAEIPSLLFQSQKPSQSSFIGQHEDHPPQSHHRGISRN